MYALVVIKLGVKMESVNISQTSRGICTGFKSVDDVEWLCLHVLKP